MRRFLWISGIVIVLDQATKIGMASWLSIHESVAVLPGLNLILAHNTGAAFSFLAGHDGWQRWFFIVLAVVVSLGLYYWLSVHAKHKMEAVAISLILGGALGNMIDRLLYGYVIDFIDVYYKNMHWPAFNIADSAIVLGAGVLVLESLLDKNGGKEQTP